MQPDCPLLITDCALRWTCCLLICFLLAPRRTAYADELLDVNDLSRQLVLQLLKLLLRIW